MEPPTDGYDDLTVDDVKARVQDGVDAAAVLAYETEHKGRVTLTQWLEKQYAEQAVADTALDEPDEVLVANQRTGMIAGMHFESAHETCVVTLTPRVEEAINKGDLRTLQHE